LTTVPALARQLTEINREYARGEAAIWVADHSIRHGISPKEARHLVEVLGLTDACYRWDVARVVCVVLEHCRYGREFTACTLYAWVPLRARDLVPRAFQWLAREGCIQAVGKQPSRAPGARGRKITVWRMTHAGEELSRSVSPIPGMTPFLAEIF
jgi:hypothetical protein